MKTKSFIIAVTVLFLSLKPGFDAFVYPIDSDAVCCNDTCSDSDTDTSEGEEKRNTCCESICNPFEVCSTCVPAYVTQYIYRHTLCALVSVKQQIRIAVITTLFTTDFWQPPKMF